MSAIDDLHDIRREAVGSYAGPIGPNAAIGTYTNGVLLRRQCTGSYAGDPDLQASRLLGPGLRWPARRHLATPGRI